MIPRSTALATILWLELLQITGPDKQLVEVNPSAIVALRAPRGTDHFVHGANCLVFTADGKYLVVVQTCDVIADQLKPMSPK